jgi:hypothetical protein
METLQLVENGKALVEAMGFWPSFHDANVMEALRDADAFAVTVHLFAMTDQVNSDGYYILEKHHLVTIALHGVQSNSLPSDYSTDCLDGLSFQRDGAFLQVEFGSHMDQGGTVVCRKAEIASVVPCTSTGVALAPNNSFKPKPLRGSA